MNYCIVNNGIIDNIIVADEEFANKIGALPSYDDAQIGSKYNPPREPTIEERLAAQIIDQEYRLLMLELGVS